MARIDLPDGAWADIIDPAKVSERKRRPITKALVGLVQNPATAAISELAAKGALTDEEKQTAATQIDSTALAAADDLNDALVVALVAAWSFEAPVTVESLVDLPGDAYVALRDRCAPRLAQMMPDFGPNADTESPTSPSSA